MEDFVKEHEIRDFFLNKIDDLLQNYEPGRPENKPEVLKQIQEITEKRKKMQEEHQRQQMMQQGQQQIVPITPDIIKQLQDQGAPPELIQQFIMQGGVPINGQQQQQHQEQQVINPQILQQYEVRFAEQQKLIQTLIKENVDLKERVSYFEKKMRSLIEAKIEEKKTAAVL